MYILYMGLLFEFTYLLSVEVEVVPLVLEVGDRNIPSRENDCNPPLFVELVKNLRLYNSVPLDISDSRDMACTICDKVARCVCVSK